MSLLQSSLLILSSFITFFSSYFCYDFLLVLPLLSCFSLGILSLSSQFPQVSLLAFFQLSVCMPILNFLFFHCTLSTFPASAPTISHVNARLQPYRFSNILCSFRTKCLCSCYFFYSHGPFLLWLTGNLA